ncbi:unnamed protein product, partial [Prorocentrum cordatum]
SLSSRADAGAWQRRQPAQQRCPLARSSAWRRRRPRSVAPAECAAAIHTGPPPGASKFGGSATLTRPQGDPRQSAGAPACIFQRPTLRPSPATCRQTPFPQARLAAPTSPGLAGPAVWYLRAMRIFGPNSQIVPTCLTVCRGWAGFRKAPLPSQKPRRLLRNGAPWRPSK